MDLLRETYPPDVMSVGTARHQIEDALEEHDLHHFRERARLLLDELVWNVVLHAGTPAVVRVTGDAAHLLVEVADGSHELPRRLHPRPEDIAGRGLVIVDELADSWGCTEVDEGKVIWARLDAASARQSQVLGLGAPL